AREIKELLEYFGYQVEEHRFTFANTINSFVAILLIVNMILIVLALVFKDSVWIVGVMMFGLFLSFNRILHTAEQGSIVSQTGEVSAWSKICMRLGKQYTTMNLVAKTLRVSETLRVSAKTLRVSRPHIYLVAHYDSKSQIMPILVRISLFAFVIGGGLTFSLLSIISSFSFISLNPFISSFPNLQSLISTLGILLLLASLPLILLDVGNKSPGAIDNASGVGTVLHLAECLALREDLRDAIDVTILIPSAEEMGLMGAAAYVQHYLASLRDEKELYVLNFDSVGIEGRLCYVDADNKHKPSRLLSLVKQTCKETNIPLSHFSLIGALMDHIPFARAGFEAISFTVSGKASWWIHTQHDSVKQLHPKGFAEVGSVAMRVIEKIA
ncbi:MAG: M28 family peptidase, partial [Chloroflexi bacterium]|nr:M28 family peptidase [Chloroflexota bacterium]